MPDIFEYDVFLSFASADEAIVRPIWQELSLSGLRVFWSDTTLKQKLGESWFDNIQSSLERSRHFLLIASPTSMSSDWVKREYRAFFQNFYREGSRRLIPLLVGDLRVEQLPLFLKELQAERFTTARDLKHVVELVGGTNVEELKQSLITLEKANEELSRQLQAATVELSSLKQKLAEQTGSSIELDQKSKTATLEISSLQHKVEDLSFALSTKEQAYEELASKHNSTAAQLSSLRREVEALTRKESTPAATPTKMDAHLKETSDGPLSPIALISWAVSKATIIATLGCVSAFIVLLAAVSYNGDDGLAVGIISFIAALAISGFFGWSHVLPHVATGRILEFSLVWTLAILVYAFLTSQLYCGLVVRDLLIMLLVGGTDGSDARFLVGCSVSTSLRLPNVRVLK